MANSGKWGVDVWLINFEWGRKWLTKNENLNQFTSQVSLFYGQSENTFRWPTFFITPNTCKYEKYFLEINFCQTKHFHNEIRGWEWKKWLIYIVSIYDVRSWWLLLIIILRYQSVFYVYRRLNPRFLIQRQEIFLVELTQTHSWHKLGESERWKHI